MYRQMAGEITKKEKVDRGERIQNRICAFWWQIERMEKVGMREKMESSELGAKNTAQRNGCQGKNDSLESRASKCAHLLREQKGRAHRKPCDLQDLDSRSKAVMEDVEWVTKNFAVLSH